MTPIKYKNWTFYWKDDSNSSPSGILENPEGEQKRWVLYEPNCPCHACEAVPEDVRIYIWQVYRILTLTTRPLPTINKT